MFNIIFIYIFLILSAKCYLFSVIIAIYNTGRYLNDAIDSVINQTVGFDKIQIILVNDGSIDDSENICLNYKQKYPKNIQYIKINHSGVSKARNIGLKYAKGNFINFLDSDDKWDINAFRHFFLFFKFYKKIDMIAGRIKFFEALNKYHLLDYKFKKSRIVSLDKEYNCIQLHVSSSFFRAKSIRTHKFDERLFYAEDVKFISNILISKKIIGIIKEAIYYYRKRSDSSSAMQNSNNFNYYFDVINYVHIYLINKSIKLYGKIIPFIQFYLAYELIYRIISPTNHFLEFNN